MCQLKVSVEEYRKRYTGEVDERVATLLGDALNLLLARYEARFGAYAPGKHAAFDRNITTVACAMVHRALAAPDEFLGAEDFTQTASIYSTHVKFANPTGDLYVSRTDLRALGLLGMSAATICAGSEVL